MIVELFQIMCCIDVALLKARVEMPPGKVDCQRYVFEFLHVVHKVLDGIEQLYASTSLEHVIVVSLCFQFGVDGI